MSRRGPTCKRPNYLPEAMAQLELGDLDIGNSDLHFYMFQKPNSWWL